MKQVLFRVDSSSKIGLGHIMRDLVLAQQFKDANVSFATQNLQGNANYKILQAGYRLHDLKSNSIQELVQILLTNKINTLIIDHYGIDKEMEKKIKERTNVHIFVLDDTYNEHYADTLLNHNLGANPKKYNNKVPSSCKLLCGTKYTLLREEFYIEKRKLQKKKKNKKIKIFIALGGTDHTQINIKTLKVLSLFSNIEVYLITTTSNENLQQLKMYVKNKKWIHLHINSSNIAKFIAQSDFAIITPSVTANEVYFMNLPFISIKTAQNQDEIHRYLKKERFFTLKQFNSKKLQHAVKELLCKISL